MDRNPRAEALKAEIRRRLWRAAAHNEVRRLDRALRTTDKAILDTLISHADELGACRLWRRTIAREASCGLAELKRSLARLRGQQLVEVEQRRATHGGFVSNAYTVRLAVPVARQLDELLELVGTPGLRESLGGVVQSPAGSLESPARLIRAPAGVDTSRAGDVGGRGGPPGSQQRREISSQTSFSRSISDPSLPPSGGEGGREVEQLVEWCRERWPAAKARRLRPDLERAVQAFGNAKAVRRYLDRATSTDPTLQPPLAKIPVLAALDPDRIEAATMRLRKVRLVNPTTSANAAPMPNESDRASALKRAAGRAAGVLSELEQPKRRSR